MSIYAGNAVQFQFNLFEPTAPYAVTDPDAGQPFSGTVIRNGVDDTSVTVTIERLGVGRFRATFSVPMSWTAGDDLKVKINATVLSAPQTVVVWNNRISARPTQVITNEQLANRGNPDHFGGAQVKAKRPTIQVRAGYTATVHHTLLQDGLPFNFEAYGFADSEAGGSSLPLPQIKASITEMRVCAGEEIFVDLLSADTAQVSFTVPDSIMQQAGIWLIEFFVVAADESKVFVTDAYLYIERSNKNFTGPPTVAEVRLFLRDFAQENELLDVVDFDGSEIAFAAEMCVAEWNEIPPPDGYHYSTNNFPYRRHWLVGICGYLFSIAADHYARNSMDYQAGGVSTDDKNKALLYAKKTADARTEWQGFARERKMIDSINRGGYDEVPGVMGIW